MNYDNEPYIMTNISELRYSQGFYSFEIRAMGKNLIETFLEQ